MNKGNSSFANAYEDFDIRSQILRYLSFWPSFLVSMIIFATIAWLYQKFKMPVFEISTSILIKDQKRGLDESKIIESLDQFSSTKILENEIEILRSNSILNKVIKGLFLYAPVSEERPFRDLSAYCTAPLKIEVRNPDELVEQKKTYLEYDFFGNKVMIDHKVYPLNAWVRCGNNTLRFTYSKFYNRSNIKKKIYFSIIDIRKATSDLNKKIEIEPSGKLSTVINIKLKDAIPKRGEDILNQLISAYNNADTEIKNQLVSNALSFIEDRLNYVVNELDSVENTLQKFKKSKGIVDIGEQGRIYLGSVEANDKKLSEINVKLAMLEEVDRYVLERDNRTGVVPSTFGLNDGNVQRDILSEMLATLYGLEIQYEQLRKNTGENNPVVISIVDQMEKIRPNILENIQSQKSNLIAAKENLRYSNSQYSSILGDMPQKERELLEISRQQSIKNNIYTFLLQKREETALSYASKTIDNRVINLVRSSVDPIGLSKIFVYILAVLGGFFFMAIILYIREVFNDSIFFKSEIVQAGNVPIIAQIANVKNLKLSPIVNWEHSAVSEQLRQLRTTVISKLDSKKKVMITSPDISDGKSFIALNLALSFALMGRRTILVDLDLRKLRSKNNLISENNLGMTSYLTGIADIHSIIKPTNLSDNLFEISNGPAELNPAELIENGKMEALFEYLEDAFQFVIVDSPPIAIVTDARILSKYIDMVIYVVRQGKTAKSRLSLIHSGDLLSEVNKKGIVFNDIKY